MPPRRSRRDSPALRKAIEKHKRAAYQEAILEAAAAMFVRLGFTEAKMADLAAEAGVSVGTLYNYFDNKDAVIASLTDHEHAAFQARLVDVDAVTDPFERVEMILRLSYQFLEERGALLAMAVQSGMRFEIEQGGQFESRKLVLRLYAEAFAQAAAAGRVRTDLSPERLALALEGLASSLVFEWVRTSRAQPLVSQADFVLDLFLKGARPR